MGQNLLEHSLQPLIWVHGSLEGHVCAHTLMYTQTPAPAHTWHCGFSRFPDSIPELLGGWPVVVQGFLQLLPSLGSSCKLNGVAPLPAILLKAAISPD